ncbi:hypothetical protein J8J27_27305, partial [Mycobacterium tuberculosis]|nr:hypothetical protein [Mycobacterium tuberculosis]
MAVAAVLGLRQYGGDLSCQLLGRGCAAQAAVARSAAQPALRADDDGGGPCARAATYANTLRAGQLPADMTAKMTA